MPDVDRREYERAVLSLPLLPGAVLLSRSAVPRRTALSVGGAALVVAAVALARVGVSVLASLTAVLAGCAAAYASMTLRGSLPRSAVTRPFFRAHLRTSVDAGVATRYCLPGEGRGRHDPGQRIKRTACRRSGRLTSSGLVPARAGGAGLSRSRQQDLPLPTATAEGLRIKSRGGSGCRGSPWAVETRPEREIRRWTAVPTCARQP